MNATCCRENYGPAISKQVYDVKQVQYSPMWPAQWGWQH